MKKIKALLRKGVELLKKPKRFWIHLALFAMMALALYLSTPHILLLKMEWMRMMVAMVIGAYAHKPMADWICRKLLEHE